jgi:predicted amidohydrolase
MTTLRIAVASTPLTATMAQAVPTALAAVEEAARLGARIVCLPEAILPGHRMQQRAVEDVSASAIDAALTQVGAAARVYSIVVLVGTEGLTSTGRELVQVVFDERGERLGEQIKT